MTVGKCLHTAPKPEDDVVAPTPPKQPMNPHSALFPPHPTPPSWAKCKRRRGWQTADLSPDLLFLGTAHVSDLRHCGDRLDVGGPGVEE